MVSWIHAFKMHKAPVLDVKVDGTEPYIKENDTYNFCRRPVSFMIRLCIDSHRLSASSSGIDDQSSVWARELYSISVPHKALPFVHFLSTPCVCYWIPRLNNIIIMLEIYFFGFVLINWQT